MHNFCCVRGSDEKRRRKFLYVTFTVYIKKFSSNYKRSKNLLRNFDLHELTKGRHTFFYILGNSNMQDTFRILQTKIFYAIVYPNINCVTLKERKNFKLLLNLKFLFEAKLKLETILLMLKIIFIFFSSYRITEKRFLHLFSYLFSIRN